MNSGILTKAERVVELRQKADGIFEKISVLSNPLLIKRSEEEYDNIIKKVAPLESKKDEKEYSEQDVIRVVKTARRFVEHLDELVLETNDEPTLRVFWEMIFPVAPNLTELKNGTPQISPILAIKEDLEKPENVVAAQLGLRWNFFVKDVEEYFRISLIGFESQLAVATVSV